MEQRFEDLTPTQKAEAYRLLEISRSRYTPPTARGRAAQVSSAKREARNPSTPAWGRSMLAKRGGHAKAGAKIKKGIRPAPQTPRPPDAIVISGVAAPWGDNGAEARQEIVKAVTERMNQVLGNDYRFQMSRRVGGSFSFDVVIVQNPPAR
jgi:hypothetical protein